MVRDKCLALWTISWLSVYFFRDIAPPGQSQTALGAAASAAVPSADTLDGDEDQEMAGPPNGIPIS